MRRATGTVALFFLALSACAPTPEAPPPLVDEREAALLVRVNAHRASQGVAALAGCRALHLAAQAHSDDMLEHDFLDEIGSDGRDARARACAAGYEPACTPDGPITELLSSGSADAEATLSLWVGSPSTAAPLLDAAKQVVGVGLAAWGSPPRWTLDLAPLWHAACDMSGE